MCGQADGPGLPALTVTDDSERRLHRRTSHGALGNRSLLDTPFSSFSIDATGLSAHQAESLGDIFFTDASVTDNSASYSAWASYLSVRGLPLDWQNSARIDGNPFVGHGVSLPIRHVERVDLLKGASGFMYGFGAPGGLINRITKKPPDSPLRSVELGYVGDAIWRRHVDLGGRVGHDDRFGYRLNASHEAGRTFNGGRVRRHAVSLALDARLTPALGWDAQAMWQDSRSRDQTPSIQTRNFNGTGLPAPVDGASRTLVGPGQHIDNRFLLLQSKLAYRFSHDWHGRFSVSRSSSDVGRNDQTLALQNTAGDYLDSRYVSRQRYTFSQWQAMLEGHVRTGKTDHRLVLGAALQQQDNHHSPKGSNPAMMGPGQLGVQNPYTFYNTAPAPTRHVTSISQRALFASDTLALSPNWSLLAGVRAAQFRQRSLAVGGRQKGVYSTFAVTPTVALMFHPRPDTTWYASLVDALEQGGTPGITHTNYGQQLPPLKSRQIELGVKMQREDWHATAALFRIARGAEYTDSGGALAQDGKADHDGVELALKFRPSSRWGLGASLMLLDARYGHGSAWGGHRVAGAADMVVTAQLAYRAIPGLDLAADAKYTGNTMLRAANDVQTPGYLLLALGASFTRSFGAHDTVWRLKLDNALNRRYWQYQYENYIKPGDPRSLRLSVQIGF